jgi:tRNA dimethylallyltransferase
VSESCSFVFIVGSSCTGKTRLSLELGEKLNWPIINSDSLQVFQEVNIGTAKPTQEEFARCRHLLFDIVPKGQSYTAANYVRDVVQAVKGENLNNAIFVGGSGFYIQALEKGLYPSVETTDEVKQKVMAFVEDKGFEEAFTYLQTRDPEYAAVISANDHYRIRRSLEILFSQSHTISELKKQMAQQAQSPLPPHRKLKVGLFLPREELRPLVLARSQEMVKGGLIEEVQNLVDAGYSRWAPMLSVGYKETQQFLEQGFSCDELVNRITTSTMQLIKKQSTWFKRDPEIKWYRSDEWPQAQASVEDWLQSSST